ncbi:WXG100-like domain-containing protein [Mycobacteroides abscessus]|uniref:WXG100-like domain-containing protein n=1 Tax=Mycobacteroides abscessus TaxID=36809 RepID=UPI000C25FA9E|nr:NAD(+)--arginine ADP-ribosyltransferase [Mycobacteroides abscessus]
MAPPIHVDPVALDGAGRTVSSSVGGWDSALSALQSALSSSAGMGGDDPAGIVFARSYDSSAKELLEAMVDVSNGAGRAADGIRASATNYSRAEVASNIDGKGGDPLPAASPTPSVKAGTPPSAVGSDVGDPPGWFLVEPFIGMIWPNGDSAKLRAAGAAWTAAGAAFTAQQAGLAGAQATAQAQQIPEGPKIDSAFKTIDGAVGEVGGMCSTMGTKLNDYAAKIDTAHASILDLLARLINPLTGAKQVVDWITGEDDDEIKKIAADIRNIVNQFKSEVQSLALLLAPIIQGASMVIDTLKSLVQMQVELFGDEIYNTVAPLVNATASLGQAMIDNPGQTIQMAAGVGMMAVGYDMMAAAGVGEVFTGGAATPVAAPVAVAGAGLLAGGAVVAIPPALDLSKEAAVNGVTVMEARTGRPGEGVNRGDDRDSIGTFTGRGGTARGYGRQPEAEGIDRYRRANPDEWVSTERRKANVDGVENGRYYDGLAQKADGTYKGIEVKSGDATRNAEQRAFDSAVSPQNPAYVTITNRSGEVETVKVTEVEVIKVAGE